MSKRRFQETYTTKQQMGTNGRLACLQCGGDITAKQRSTFCSKECATEFAIKTSGSAARWAVYQRDKGICAKCRKDTMAHRRERESFLGEYQTFLNTGHLWQADHIKPVVEGGGECGIENYRTLCTPCHKKETAELAKRRAAERKRQIAETVGQYELQDQLEGK